MKIYISPSTQEKNLYKTGGNEEQYMRLIAGRVLPRLVEHGHDVMLGGDVSATANATESNRWGAELYVALHSNAGGGQGTIVFYYEGSAASKKLARALHDRVAPVSPGKDYGIRRGNQFVEVNTPKAPAALVEVEFHDSVVGSDHIKNNIDAYTNAVANGILDVAGRKAVPAPKPAPKPKPVASATKTVSQLADEVIAGKHGSGNVRRRSLGSRYSEVQAEVNRRLLGGKPKPPAPKPKPKKKSITTVAYEVIRGKWGVGTMRKVRLTLAGYNYRTVQNEVNRILGR